MVGKLLKLGIETLQDRGFSASIADTDLPQQYRDEIAATIEAADKEVEQLIEASRRGMLDILPGRSQAETLELRILEVLNKSRNKCGEVVAKAANKETAILIMADSGARGNIINLAQMVSSVGQQSLKAQRIASGYNNRTLSCFKEHDLGSEARGFIENSFKSGLSPNEFFFAAMTGRDSLMDTALRTPRSGYLYRRLENSMQDLKVGYDGTVRDANEKIIQFKYGEDGVDVSRSENGKLNVKRIIEKVMSE
jgi:DNA-directed RNA polymerase subunit A'